MQPTIANWLAVSPLGLLSDSDQDLLSQRCQLVTFRKKQQIYRQGANRKSVFYVIEGFARQTRQAGEMGAVTVAVLGPNEILGLLGVIEDSPYMLSAVAITSLTAAEIPVTVIRDLLHSRPGFLRFTAEMLSTHLAQAYQAITQSGYSRVDQRILSALIEFGTRYGESENGQLRLSVPLTRNEIAAISHTTVETTIRTLGKWRKQGWIVTQDRKITLVHVDLLVNQVLHRS